MTEKSDTKSVVRDLFEKPTEPPKHKQLFDEFVAEAVNSYYILDYLFLCYPDLYLSPGNAYGGEQVMCAEIDHSSELAQEVDWLGGDFSQEKITFSVQQDGSLLRIIEISPKINPSKAESGYINANLGTAKGREFTEYVMGEPWENVEGILPFLEINDEERQEIDSLHHNFRRRYFIANASLAHSKSLGDISD